MHSLHLLDLHVRSATRGPAAARNDYFIRYPALTRVASLGMEFCLRSSTLHKHAAQICHLEQGRRSVATEGASKDPEDASSVMSIRDILSKPRVLRFSACATGSITSFGSTFSPAAPARSMSESLAFLISVFINTNTTQLKASPRNTSVIDWSTTKAIRMYKLPLVARSKSNTGGAKRRSH